MQIVHADAPETLGRIDPKSLTILLRCAVNSKKPLDPLVLAVAVLVMICFTTAGEGLAP